MTDVPASFFAAAPTRAASPVAHPASAIGGIDSPPSSGSVPSAPRPPSPPIAHRTRARKGLAAKRPVEVSGQPEPPVSEPPKLVDPPPEQLVALSRPPLAFARTKKGVSKASVKVIGLSGEEAHFNEMPLKRLLTEVQVKFNIQQDFALVVRDETRYDVDTEPALQIALKWAIQHGFLLVLSVNLGFWDFRAAANSGARARIL